MVSKSKLYTQLDLLESELREKLVPRLESAFRGKNDLIFCVASFNPFTELKSKTDSETEALIHIGTQILGLREKLGEPSEGTIAERICWYCREWGSPENGHRKSAPDLAKQFLEEIDRESSKS